MPVYDRGQSNWSSSSREKPDRQKGKDIDSIKRSEVAEGHLVRAGDADGISLTCGASENWWLFTKTDWKSGGNKIP